VLFTHDAAKRHVMLVEHSRITPHLCNTFAIQVQRVILHYYSFFAQPLLHVRHADPPEPGKHVHRLPTHQSRYHRANPAPAHALILQNVRSLSSAAEPVVRLPARVTRATHNVCEESQRTQSTSLDRCRFVNNLLFRFRPSRFGPSCELSIADYRRLGVD
jgi:hypothetical protein